MKELFRIAKSAEGQLYLIWRDGNSVAPFNKAIVKAIRKTIREWERFFEL